MNRFSARARLGMVLIGLAVSLTALRPAAAQPAKIALVIGNAGYTDAPKLPQAKNDAQAMAQTLEQLGFQVLLALDADKRGMDEAMERFGKRIENGGVALFYYSGHGLQEDGINYLIPLASGIKKKADIPYQAVSANWALASMEEWNEQGVNLMILDACRTPFKGMTKNGLAPMEAAGSVVAYATAANTPAEIEPGATYSIYTAQLLKVLQANPCQKITDLLLEVADLVVAGGSGQQPYLTLSPGVRRFQFAECAAPTPAPTPPPAPPQQGGEQASPRLNQAGAGGCWEDETAWAECREDTTGMEFVYVPGGCFRMGQTDTEKAQLINEVGEENYKNWLANELPRHQVCVNGFWIGKYEVTNAQYRRFKPDHKNYEYEGKSLNGDDQPVVMVSWNDAQAFLRKLNAAVETHGRASLQFRLPTEAEWEYAARGGAETIRYWGDDPKHTQACAYANVADQTAKKIWTKWTVHECDDDYAVTAPVGSFRPNDFGLYDMLGNVWEWCLDVYASYSDTPTDGNAYGSFDDKTAKRLLRGSSWNHHPYLVRSANRYWYESEFRSSNLGIRVVRLR